MSLISTKNLAAPFTSTVNLVTIIVLALLFGIYRLSGGGVYVVERGARNDSSSAPRPFVAPAAPAQKAPARESDPFADLLKPSPKKQPPQNTDDLNEVERKLGLRN